MSNYDRDNNQLKEADESSYKSRENFPEIDQQNSKNMPVKSHIRKLEQTIIEINKDISDNIKAGHVLRSENLGLENKFKEKTSQLTKNIMDELFNFDKELRKVIDNDKNETHFLKKQLNFLITDKTNIDKSRILLNSKLQQCENEIGIDL